LKNDRITGSVEVYQKSTSNLLLSVAVPQPAVVPTQLENIGSLRNRGLEANVDWQMYNAPHRSLTGGLVFTVERNQVTSLGDATAACAGDGTGFAATRRRVHRSPREVNGQEPVNQWLNLMRPADRYVPCTSAARRGDQYFACTRSTRVTRTPVVRSSVPNPSFTVGLRNATWNSWVLSWPWRWWVRGKVFLPALVYESVTPRPGPQLPRRRHLGSRRIHEPAKFSSRWIEDRTFVRHAKSQLRLHAARAN
jgi:iron complex outermembrane receptor protein